MMTEVWGDDSDDDWDVMGMDIVCCTNVYTKQHFYDDEAGLKTRALGDLRGKRSWRRCKKNQAHQVVLLKIEYENRCRRYYDGASRRRSSARNKRRTRERESATLWRDLSCAASRHGRRLGRRNGNPRAIIVRVFKGSGRGKQSVLAPMAADELHSLRMRGCVVSPTRDADTA